MGKKIEVRRHNPPTTLAVTVTVTEGGRVRERDLGARGVFTLEEAAAYLDRPPSDVLRAIRAGFLRAQPGRRRGSWRITLQSAAQFEREEQADIAALRRLKQRREPTIPWEQVKRELRRR